MASRLLPGLSLTGFWDLGEDNWKDANDANLRTLSATVQARVLSRVASVPGSPTNGDMHIITAGGDANKMAIRDNGAWVYLTPAEGWLAYSVADAHYYTFDGTAWVVLATGGGAWTVGTGVPTGGADGDHYLRTTNGDFYERAAGSWTVVANLSGASGNSVLNGTTAPVSGTGANGDFYIDTATWTIYGPKAGGSWPSGVSLGGGGSGIPAFSFAVKTASYTALSADFSGNKMVEMDVASANTFTVNSGLTGIEPLVLAQKGVGQTTIVAGSGVTILAANGLKLRTKDSLATLVPVGSNVYRLSGDTAV